MSLGLLNTTIAHLAQYIFIDKNVFLKVAGAPDYDSKKVLHLRLHRTPLHSFVVLNRKVSDTFSLNFDLELPQGSVFNFVFNFVDEGNFEMLRLDNRRNLPTPNSVLHCTQKYFWKEILFAEPDRPPEEPLLVEIKIDFPKQVFAFVVNGVPYKFKDRGGTTKDIFGELKPDLRIGFFNEVGAVKLSNICL